MNLAIQDTSTCSTCGAVIEQTTSGDIGCAVCLLRVGLSDEIAAEPDRHLPSDGRFGIYEIERREDGSFCELGRGAMGVTYCAVDTSLRRKAALKIIKAELAAPSREARERFMRGARAAAALCHENVATVYQFGIREETGQCFYAMELIEGETLEERVRRSGPLDARKTVGIARAVTEALMAAEKCGLVHRDLKPANLMLIAADGGNAEPKVKIIDFGLAKAINGENDPMWLTRDGFVGTPAFASPEQFDHARLDVRSDIYSLAVTLWFALTGRTPFAGRSVDEIRSAQRSESLPVDQLRAARAPSWMISLLRSMLAVEPAARPSLVQLNERLRSGGARRLPSLAFAGISTVIILAIATLFWRWPILPNSGGINAPVRMSIGILPFTNLGRDPDTVYFVDGIRTEIVARLSKIGALQVVVDSSPRRFENVQQNAEQIAAALGVAKVLQGSVQKNGDNFTINVRLTDAKKHVDLWSQSYERPFSRVTEVETETAKQVAVALGLRVTEFDKRLMIAGATTNPRAYEAYLKGRSVWLQRTSDAYTQAQRYFEEAIALDPKYAPAYAGLADAFQFLGGFDFTIAHRAENYAKAKQSCQRALQIDPDLAEAHASLGLIAMNYDWDWTRADEEFQRALALGPNNAMIHDWYGEYLMTTGRAEAAVHELTVARQLDPLSRLINSDLGKILYLARQYGEAKGQLTETIRMDPAFDQPRYWLGYVLTTTGDFDGAIQEFQKLWPVGVSNWQAGLLGYAYGMAGRKSEAQQMFEIAKRSVQHGSQADKLPMVWACMGIGDYEQALTYLIADCDAHSTSVSGLQSLPWFDPLRSNPRFVDLVRRVHLVP